MKNTIHETKDNTLPSAVLVAVYPDTSHDESELAMCDRIYLLKDSTLSPYEYDGNVSHLAEMLK